jgi:hypothetical protein
MTPNDKASMDDWLNEGIEDSLAKASAQSPPRTAFPTVPSGIGVPAKPEPAPPKPKTLATLGIGRGGVVRNATTTVRSKLNNPVANPKSAQTRSASVLDSGADGGLLKEAPEIGVPSLLTEMDADFEKSAKDRVAQVLPAPPASDQPPEQEKTVTMRSTLEELIALARANAGSLEIGTRQFSLSLEIKAPF